MPDIRWEIDPYRSMRTGFHVDHASGELTVVHQEDVSFLLKKNRELFNATDASRRRTSEWHMWARIPNGIIAKWKSELGVDIMKEEDWQKVRELLHHPDWSGLRTSAGSYLERPAREYMHTVKRENRTSRLVGSRSKPIRRGGL
jgi:hypothetical protein